MPIARKEKSLFFGGLAPFLGRIASEVRREGMLRKLADILDVDYRSMEVDLGRIEKKIGIPKKN